ncbi:MAG: glutathione peroxidase [Polyangiaceae bacterium]
MNIYATDTRSLSGEAATLARFAGQVTLIVNVASECGFTRQYAGLEALQRRFRERGFSVLGFPCNDFGGQEPGTPEQIQDFCSTRFDVSFPLFEKVVVKAGAGQAALYATLAAAAGALPKWNFGKYLVGRDGRVIDYYASSVEPDDTKLLAAIEAALAVAA